ncbi:methylated-DNA--[protein]-cysteine S-methyltransferase [Adlercreutzia murintestinalis]|jgi:O-6-methylguanine DNA methyltransferase|uniref:methylated-DNA--[protein]-cysteine S-methyltransferase n=1 Tax=Adlercreutzia murintestinalis TaxID=2941325 RepID=UPI0020413B38|nr:methylated-DNA--[protein]-cysteine S-methyltransferase [Adlercreutzia murintestinalis]
MRSRTYFTYRTPYGPLTIGGERERIYRVALGHLAFEGERRPSAATNACADQLLEYFAGKRTSFTVDLLVEGTLFQKEVWQAIGDIPYGQVRTATHIAHVIGRPNANRAVGQAVSSNPLAILIPAHRVTSASGRTVDTDRAAQLRAALRKLERSFA